MTDLRRDPPPGRRSLRSLTLLAYYNSYPSSRIQHFCTGQWYLLVMEELQRLGYVDRAEAWFVSDVPQTFTMHNVTVRCFRSFTEMARASAATDVLWVRGKCGPYVEVLNAIPARLRVYYAASKRFVPLEWNHFDVLLVDDTRMVEPVRRLAGNSSVFKVVKTADPRIFRPLAGVAKRFDLCMIGGMHITRKNFDALVRVLCADPALSAVIVGKQTADLRQALDKTGSSIAYFDFLGREELNRVINECRVGFVPSVLDAAPRVIMEYLAAGVPVLLNAAVLGGRDYITPETGLLATVHEFSAAARQLLAGSNSLNPRKGFDEDFHPEKAARHLGEIMIAELDRRGRVEPARPPSLLRRLVSRPFMLRRRLARYWQEIEAE